MITAKVLSEAVTLGLDPTKTTVYTAPTSTTTIVDKFTLASFHTTTSVVTVYIVPSGGAAADGNAVLNKTLAAHETYICPEVVGQILAQGDSIVATSSTNYTSARASGREVT